VPTYRYKSRCQHDCDCQAGVAVFQTMAATPLQACPRCGCGVYRAIQVVPVKVKDYEEYRPDLSRFPGDPQANVSSKIGLGKLVQQRQREGWGDPKKVDDVSNLGQNAPSQPDRAEVREGIRKAMQEAGL